MGKRGNNSLALCELATLFLVQIFVLATGQSTSASWKTLNGKAPSVIARGGFSGTFPDSSESAYSFAQIASLPDTILLCDVHLTKDGVPLCLAPSITLDNSTSIADIYPNGKKRYDVNGETIAGWFAVDYKLSNLSQVTLRQPIWSRTEKFDYSFYPILSVTDLTSQVKPSSLWLNMQYPTFYQQHGLNMRNSVISLSKQVVINYISSPEVDFLRGLSNRVSSKTKLIFRFLPETETDPSTNQTYGSLKQNLTYVKTFASGILVPKGYIWPVTSDNYLQDQPTQLVTDAHKAGLEVYAADFANDNLFSYNYSYDPLAEYLQFINKGDFSVDGFLTDYPITPSSAIGCFKDLNSSDMNHERPLIISHNGASGDYPDCTDMAYQKAVNDGSDIIDCTVQVTMDKELICMSSINLIGITTVTQSQFRSRTSIIPALQSTAGIFTFNLTWNEISKSLKPVISSPESQYYLSRNPRNKNSGVFLKLSDFLAFAKGKDLEGVLLILEHVAFIQEELGIDIIGAVTSTLTEAGYGNMTSHVNVLSTDSAVLTKLHQNTKYKLIYKIDTDIRDAATAAVADIKRFAYAVVIDKYAVYPEDYHFITNMTNTVNRFQSAGLKVYASGFMNEFVAQAWDFFSDPTVELNTFFNGANIDGFVTDFPATARRYKRSPCFIAGNNNNTPSYFEPVQVGGLIQLIVAPAQPPALAPLPVLSASDVLEAPLPPASSKTPSNASAPTTQTAHAPSTPSHASKTVTCIFLVVFSLPIIVLLA